MHREYNYYAVYSGVILYAPIYYYNSMFKYKMASFILQPVHWYAKVNLFDLQRKQNEKKNVFDY